MPNYRHAYVPGGMFFFTLVTNRRAESLCLCDVPGRPLLESILRRCQMCWPMLVNATILLLDHLHTIWTLQAGDAGYPTRWRWIEKEFSKEWLCLGGHGAACDGRATSGAAPRGVWQPRFWKHTMRDFDDFEQHFDYIHYNPVKHGLACCPHGWRWSSFHR